MTALSSSNKDKRPSTSLNSRKSLIRRLRRGKRVRADFVSSHIDKGIAYQIRALRDRRKLRQEDLMEMVGMNQNTMSRLENPRYGKATLTTLKRLAEAFDVALIVRFVPFSQLVDWASGTPFIDHALSTNALAVPSFDEEEDKKVFEEPVQESKSIWIEAPSGVDAVSVLQGKVVIYEIKSTQERRKPFETIRGHGTGQGVFAQHSTEQNIGDQPSWMISQR